MSFMTSLFPSIPNAGVRRAPIAMPIAPLERTMPLAMMPVGPRMLSAHFSLDELTRSDKAKQLGIDNIPSATEIAFLELVCRNVLEPVRAHFARPVRINSGFRCKRVNDAVGSNDKSQHRRGQAVDFEIDGISNQAIAQWVRTNLRFTQLILENHTPGIPSSGWVHVGYNAADLRGDILTWAPKRGYLKGLVA